jgi:hypothetical protein
LTGGLLGLRIERRACRQVSRVDHANLAVPCCGPWDYGVVRGTTVGWFLAPRLLVGGPLPWLGIVGLEARKGFVSSDEMPLSGRSVAMPAGAPSRRSSLSKKREMILASREAGFDLTKLASERTTVLESSISNTQLCIKRDTILDLFNELLKRLMDEQAKIKHTDLLRFWFLVSGFSDCRLL